MLLCLQFIRFSVSSINQGWTLFSHTREWGRHAENRQKMHRGLDILDSGLPSLVFISLFSLPKRDLRELTGGYQGEREDRWGRLRLKVLLSP